MKEKQTLQKWSNNRKKRKNLDDIYCENKQTKQKKNINSIIWYYPVIIYSLFNIFVFTF